MDVRFITSLLARTRRQGLEFKELRVPVQELLAPGQRKLSKKDYTNLPALQARLTDIRIQLASPYLAIRQFEQARLPMLSYVQYEKQKGWLRVKLADELRPYFDQSGVTYTSAPYAQLIKLKSPLAHRLYWLLRENAAHGKRTLELAQLAWMLNLPVRGFNFSLFCRRELQIAQQQLAVTDLPCTMELEYTSQKSRLHAVRFQFTPLSSARPTSLLLDIESKPSGGSWFGPEEEYMLGHWLFLLFGICGAYAAMAVSGAG